MNSLLWPKSGRRREGEGLLSINMKSPVRERGRKSKCVINIVGQKKQRREAFIIMFTESHRGCGDIRLWSTL